MLDEGSWHKNIQEMVLGGVVLLNLGIPHIIPQQPSRHYPLRTCLRTGMVTVPGAQVPNPVRCWREGR
jgi:hypothetical protein